MLKIVLCEDNVKQREKMIKILESILASEKFDGEIALETDNPLDVIAYAEDNNNESNLFILDIDLNSKLNGLTLAKKLRDLSQNFYIIFVTSHPELSMMTFQYKLRVLDYITKDDFTNLKLKMIENLRTIKKEISRKKVNEPEETILIESGSRSFNVPLNDIMFFETAGKDHKLKMHTSNNIIEFYGTLKELELKYSNVFYRCHKSYLVNINNITEINHCELTVSTKNGEECYISKQYKKGMMNICKK